MKNTKSKPKSKKAKQARQMPRAKLQKVLPLLRSLKNAPAKHRPALLSTMNNTSCNVIYDAIHNVLSSPYLPPKKKKQLKKTLLPYKKELRYLANNTNCPITRKKRLIKMGGVFPFAAILKTAIPLVMSLLK